MICRSGCEVVDVAEVVVDIHDFAVARQRAVVNIRRYSCHCILPTTIIILILNVLFVNNVVITRNIVVSIRLAAVAAAAPVETVETGALVTAPSVTPTGCIGFFRPLLREVFSQ